MWAGFVSRYPASICAMVGKTISHYRILAALGRGGMGVVYKAEDTRLGRTVALKFVPESMATDRLSIERFQREARAVSVLNHPNICTLHDIDEIDGRPFLVMEHLEGEDLRARLQKAPLELDELTRLAIQMADALEAAHTRGIVHRDIKPANLFLTTRGQIKIMDFGLAKLAFCGTPAETGASQAPTAAMDQQLTSPGTAIGTVAYMSPEQARGEDLDARTDLFSFGVVLYEMATRKSPFLGTTTALTFVSILQTTPEAPGQLRPGLPRELDGIISKALQKNRAERYQSAAEVRADLKRVRRGAPSISSQAEAAAPAAAPAPAPSRRTVIAAGSATLAVASGLVYAFFRERPLDSLAVLPFVNAGGDPSAEYLSDGITESIINNLSQMNKLAVRSFSSVAPYKKKDATPQQAGRELEVRAVLTGRLAPHGEELDVSAELIDVRQNRQIWGNRYTRRKADLLAVQEEISREVSEKLRMKMSGADQQRMARRGTENTEAYQLYLQGRYQWNRRTLDGIQQSIDYFQQAIRKDPRYALAYAGEADSYALLADFNVLPTKEVMPKARGAAAKALELDETLAEAHTSLAWAKFHDWDWAAAEKEFRRAIQVNSGYVTAHLWYGEYLMARGRFEEAQAQLSRAMQLNPASPVVSLASGYRYYYARQYTQAIEQWQKTLAAEPAFLPAHAGLGRAYGQKGMNKEAIAEFRRALELSEGDSSDLAALAYAYALGQQRADAAKILAQLQERSQQTYVQPMWIAVIHAALGEKDRAHDWMQRAEEDRSAWLLFLKVDPVFDSMRQEPWFAELTRRVGI